MPTMTGADPTPPPTRRAWLQNLALALGSLLLILLLLEVVVRVAVPLPRGQWANAPLPEWGIFHRVPDQRGQYVRGVFGRIHARFSTNNYGWNSGQDYQGERTPGVMRVAVIGDSFVEARQVDPDRAFPERAQAALNESGACGPVEIYRFGVSGAPLTQYPPVARYVAETFHPDLIVVLIYLNDYDDSQSLIGGETVFWRGHATADGWETLPPTRDAVTSLPPPRSPSALINYIRYLVLSARAEGADYTAPPPLSPADREALVRHVLGELQQISGGDLLLMLSPATPGQWRESRPAVHPDHQLTVDLAAEMGIDTLSLTPVFGAHDDASDQPVDFLPLDGHWNATGHALAAEALTAHLAARCAAP
jgi:hypothetical protein